MERAVGYKFSLAIPILNLYFKTKSRLSTLKNDLEEIQDRINAVGVSFLNVCMRYLTLGR